MKINKKIVKILFLLFVIFFVGYRLFFVTRYQNYLEHSNYKNITSEIKNKLLDIEKIENVIIYESDDDIPIPFIPESFSMKIILKNKIIIDLKGVKRNLKFRKDGGIKSLNDVYFSCEGDKRYLNYFPIDYLSYFLNKKYDNITDIVQDIDNIFSFCKNLNLTYTYYYLNEKMSFTEYEKKKKEIGHYKKKNDKRNIWIYKDYKYKKTDKD